jgi:hypothetical protein
VKTLGEFYREKILNRTDLYEIEWPFNNGNIEVIKDLFGWKLSTGKNHVDCQSEEEARYLKVFFDAGLKGVFIPKETTYLKSILPELEQLKQKIDIIMNEYLETILNRRSREQLKHEVFMEIMK